MLPWAEIAKLSQSFSGEEWIGNLFSMTQMANFKYNPMVLSIAGSLVLTFQTCCVLPPFPWVHLALPPTSPPGQVWRRCGQSHV